MGGGGGRGRSQSRPEPGTRAPARRRRCRLGGAALFLAQSRPGSGLRGSSRPPSSVSALQHLQVGLALLFYPVTGCVQKITRLFDNGLCLLLALPTLTKLALFRFSVSQRKP